MRRVVALAVAVILLMAASVPASAASWFQLRINPSSASWTQSPPIFSDLPYNQTANMFGLTGFIQIPNWRIGLRANIDTGSLSSWGCPSTGGPPCFYDSGNWRWYDIGVGFPLTLGTGQVLLFTGYGNTDWQASSAGVLVTQQRTSGWVFGADVMWPIGSSGRWYLTGNVTYGPGQQYLYCNPTPGFPCNTSNARATGTANVGIYSGALGWNLPGGMSSLELGWKSGGFNNATITSGDPAVLGQNVRWDGVYLGLTVRK